MRIDVLGNKLDLTPSIKKYIDEKFTPLGKMLSRFEHEGETILFIEIARSTKHHKKGDVFYAEATLKLPGKTLRAEHFDVNIRTSIDMIRGVLREEIKKFKEKKQEKYGKREKNIQ